MMTSPQNAARSKKRRSAKNKSARRRKPRIAAPSRLWPTGMRQTLSETSRPRLLRPPSAHPAVSPSLLRPRMRCDQQHHVVRNRGKDPQLAGTTLSIVPKLERDLDNPWVKGLQFHY